MSPSKPSRKITNADFIALDIFFGDLHPLFISAWEAIWRPDWRTRHSLIANMLGVSGSPADPEPTDVLEEVLRENHYRLNALEYYLKQWSGAQFITITPAAVTFDALQRICWMDDNARLSRSYKRHLGDDFLTADITLKENMVLGLALAWRIHIGDSKYQD